jgi:ribosome maturation factor RimP
MAFDAEQIRVVGQRVAASHGLDVLEIEFSGPAKHRLLRVFIEKNAEERRKLLEATESMSLGEGSNPGLKIETRGSQATVETDSDPHLKSEMWGTQSGTRVGTAGVDQLAGVTHEDCEAFSRDFGTVVDVEDLIPGGEYTLEVSSPGLDRKLHGIEDYQRFSGMLVKVQTFEPVAGNRHWLGRLTEVSEESVKLTPQGTGKRTPSAGKKKAGKQEAAGSAADLEIALKNIEKAQLVPEF